MSDQVKAWVNRIGLVAIIVGIVGVGVAGGDAQVAVNTGFTVSAVVGTVILIIKEIIASLKK